MTTHDEFQVMLATMNGFAPDVLRLARVIVMADIGLTQAEISYRVNLEADRGFLSDLLMRQALGMGIAEKQLEQAILTVLQTAVTADYLDNLPC